MVVRGLALEPFITNVMVAILQAIAKHTKPTVISLSVLLYSIDLDLYMVLGVQNHVEKSTL